MIIFEPQSQRSSRPSTKIKKHEKKRWARGIQLAQSDLQINARYSHTGKLRAAWWWFETKTKIKVNEVWIFSDVAVITGVQKPVVKKSVLLESVIQSELGGFNQLGNLTFLEEKQGLEFKILGGKTSPFPLGLVMGVRWNDWKELCENLWIYVVIKS